jgi:hypothetical protein
MGLGVNGWINAQFDNVSVTSALPQTSPRR